VEDNPLFRKIMLAAALAVLPAWTAPHREMVRIPVRLENLASIDEGTILRASGLAASFFHRAGLEIEWQIVSNPNRNTTSDPVLTLRILAPSMEDAGGRHRLGVAIPESGVGYIYFSRVKASWLAATDSFPTALAYVLAHEAGHLLGLRHSGRGIMTASFDNAFALNIRSAMIGFNDFDSRRLRTLTRQRTDVNQGQ
jgi:hypothetical protein